MHLGFDRSAYPGDDIMQSLWDNTPMAFAGFYLAPAPNHGDTAWMGKGDFLRQMGWGFLPVYVGRQAGSPNLTTAQGTSDGDDATTLAQTAGFASDAVVYLDIEVGGTLTQAFLDYISAWTAEVAANGARPGVYCSFSQTAAQITGQVGDIPVWVFHPTDAGPSVIDLGSETAPDPLNSGFGAAIAWQYRMSLNGHVDLTWTDGSGATKKLVQVDVDSAVVLDPCNPVFSTPTVSAIAPTTATAGDTVAIDGSDFEGVIDVAFGGASAANLAVVSDSHLEAVVPAGIRGTVDVVVSNRWGNQSAPGTQIDIT
jgi:hypothetical protein